MKNIILSLILTIAGSVGITGCRETLKECQNEQNKISGCVVKLYYPNGNLSFKIPYKNGKVEGIGNVYFPSGELWYETRFKNDKKEGIEKQYYDNGDLKVTLIHKDGKAISGKCGNGKVLTEFYLYNINKRLDSDLDTFCRSLK